MALAHVVGDKVEAAYVEVTCSIRGGSSLRRGRGSALALPRAM
jgi:hypothetical protein